MSTNLVLVYEREILVLATGSKETQEIRSRLLWETPTDVTYSLLASDDVFSAYCNWVTSVSHDCEFDVYADDDYFCEGDKIGVEVVNYGADHIEELTLQIEYMQSEGYTLNWYAI